MATTKEKKTAIEGHGKKSVFQILANGTEVVEEYDTETWDLVSRRTRRSRASSTGAEQPWTYEIGEDPAVRSARRDEAIAPSLSSPTLVRVDSRTNFEWRIRNVPWPEDVFTATVDVGQQKIVVRTSNKKWFGKIEVPDLARAGLRLDDSSTVTRKLVGGTTLVVSLPKPQKIIDIERVAREEAVRIQSVKEEDTKCDQQ